MRNYWLCVTTKENWDILKKKKIWGVSKTNSEILNRVKPGDYLIFYIKGKTIGGVFEATSNPFIDSEKIFDTKGFIENERFPNRIRLKPLVVPDNPLKLEKVIHQLSFISNKETWSHHFRRAMRSIPKKDCEIIIRILKQI
jgi:predicted RNA-binding protein